MAIITTGVDLAKNVFAVHGVNVKTSTGSARTVVSQWRQLFCYELNSGLRPKCMG